LLAETRAYQALHFRLRVYTLPSAGLLLDSPEIGVEICLILSHDAMTLGIFGYRQQRMALNAGTEVRVIDRPIAQIFYGCRCVAYQIRAVGIFENHADLLFVFVLGFKIQGFKIVFWVSVDVTIGFGLAEMRSLTYNRDVINVFLSENSRMAGKISS
jgi:hypothetical protein